MRFSRCAFHPLLWLMVAIAFLAIAACSQGEKEEGGAGGTCGVERWAVKTLADADVQKVNFTPVSMTVDELTHLRAPGTLPDRSRLAPVETTTYSVNAVLLGFKLEADHDIHAVIAEPRDPGETMIVEFPDAPGCTSGAAPEQARAMADARKTFIEAVGQPTKSFHRMVRNITVTGVGFFDFQHGQTGVAPNAIELHPVLAVSVAP
ncbi:MAG: hypothetical protein HY261_03255 [Chloroflexi bacterium]|nr:hypothetical protein [Chloroflexota bacterium]